MVLVGLGVVMEDMVATPVISLVGCRVSVGVAVSVPVAVRVGDELGVGVGATPGTVSWSNLVWLLSSASVAFT